MKDNPFTSDIFTTIWLKHFNKSAQGFRFSFVRDLLFVKHKLLPIYSNYGKTHTKGISYALNSSSFQDLKGKVLLIYDVPTYFDLTETTQSRIKKYKIKQYPGFLINLEPFNGLNEFMVGTFKKSSRYKLKKYKNKLETCFEINYKMFYGEISKKEYDFVFEAFKNLLTKRFSDKQESNNNLEKHEWDFYYEVAYPMIMGKKAGLFVIYNGSKPIGITLNYFSEDILFDAITVFDIDYAKFHLGSVTIMKLIEWSIEQKIKVFDFSKGYFDYKKRWSTKEYDFEYHIYYDSASVKSRGIAFILKNYFRMKQYLRDQKVNEKLHQLTFALKNKSAEKSVKSKYKFSEVEKEHNVEELTPIDWNTVDNYFLKTIVFDFLYLNSELLKNTSLYEIDHEQKQYLLVGASCQKLLQIE